MLLKPKSLSEGYAWNPLLKYFYTSGGLNSKDREIMRTKMLLKRPIYSS